MDPISSTLTDKVIQALDGHSGHRLFLNNSGLAWKGDYFSDYKISTRAGVSTVIELVNARKFSYGLAPDAPRLIGYKEVLITYDMVGQKMAQFEAIETITPEYDRLPQDAKKFIDALINAGGSVSFARKNGTQVEIEEVVFEEQKQ